MSDYSSQLSRENPRIWQEMIMIEIMERFHWTYEEYLNTPSEIIDLIIWKSNLDNKRAKYGS